MLLGIDIAVITQIAQITSVPSSHLEYARRDKKWDFLTPTFDSVERLFKCGNIQNTRLTADKVLNSSIRATLIAESNSV